MCKLRHHWWTLDPPCGQTKLCSTCSNPTGLFWDPLSPGGRHRLGKAQTHPSLMQRLGSQAVTIVYHSFWSIHQEPHSSYLIPSKQALLDECLHVTTVDTRVRDGQWCNPFHTIPNVSITFSKSSLSWRSSGLGRRSGVFMDRLPGYDPSSSLGGMKKLIVLYKVFQHPWHSGRSGAWGVWRGRQLKWSVVYKMHHLFLSIHLHLVCTKLLNILPENRNIIHFHNFWIIEIFSKTENTASFYRPFRVIERPWQLLIVHSHEKQMCRPSGSKDVRTSWGPAGDAFYEISGGSEAEKEPQRQSGETCSLSRITSRPRGWVSGTADNSRRSEPQTWPFEGLANIFPEQDQGGEVSRIHVSGMCLFFQQAFCTVSHWWKETRFPHLFSLWKERQKEKETTWSSQKPEAVSENWSRRWPAVLLLGMWYFVLQNLRSLPTSQD